MLEFAFVERVYVHLEGLPTLGFGKSVYVNSRTDRADIVRQHCTGATYWRLSCHSWRSGTLKAGVNPRSNLTLLFAETPVSVTN